MEQTSPPATTYQETSGRYRTTADARERFEALAVRDVSARALTALLARGDYDPREFGLDAAEHAAAVARADAAAGS
jgi:hypothetical protein